MIALLIDVTKCIGCENCVFACIEKNDLGKQIPNPKNSPDGLSANRYTSIVRKKAKTTDGKNFRYVKKQCRHCLEPACVSACLVGAMQKSPEGPVIYDKDACMGCRYCMVACPYGIPRYQWDSPVPYVRKCDLCYDRIKDGKEPACSEACPQKAIIFGDRDMLLAKAKKRIKESPGKYIGRVYGEHEVGGTSVLYISDIPLGFLGWSDDLGDEALPGFTWKALHKVPAEFLGMGAVMAGLYWIIERRAKLRREKASADKKEQETKENEENE